MGKADRAGLMVGAGSMAWPGSGAWRVGGSREESRPKGPVQRALLRGGAELPRGQVAQPAGVG